MMSLVKATGHTRTIALGQGLLVAIAVMTCVAMPRAAVAAYGDGFGIAPINQPGFQTAPAFKEPSGAALQRAFWAGTCDRAAAPALEEPIPGGIGSRPATIKAPIVDPPFFESLPAPTPPKDCIDWGLVSQYPGVVNAKTPWADAPAWRLSAMTAAGAHPDATAVFHYARETGEGRVDGAVDNIVADLPPGFVGDPNAVPKCTAEQFALKPLRCPPETQVGVVQLYLAAATGTGNAGGAYEEVLPVYNLEPRRGNAAELGFGYASAEEATTVRVVADVRTDGDFGVRGLAAQVPAALPLIGQSITLWGVPWATHNDLWRPPMRTSQIPPQGLDGSPDPIAVTTGVTARVPIGWEPSWGPVRPFLSNPTECDGAQPRVRLATDSYLHPGKVASDGKPDIPPLLETPSDWQRAVSHSPPVSACDRPAFGADLDLQPSSRIADAPSGLDVELRIPQNRDLPFPVPPLDASQTEIDEYLASARAHWNSDAGLATAQLNRAVVTLPEGVSVNPAGAAGLDGCSDAQIGVTDSGTHPMLFNDGDPFDKDGGADGAECPDASKIGTVEVETPLLEEPLTGEIVLGTPKSTNPLSGDMFRMFVVVRNRDRGLMAKVFGSAVADPATGRLTATFDRNPRVPFGAMRLRFKGGERGLLALPQDCGSRSWVADFAPWTAAHGAGGVAVSDGDVFVTDQRCALGLAPRMAAGTSPRLAGSSGNFAFRLAREDGQQWFERLSVALPDGLLAAVRGVPLCSNAQASANACPAGSRIGSVDAGAGSGAPFFLERKGTVYLTEGYRGAPYGLAVSVPVEAGPFRGQFALDPIVVRQALHVDRTSAAVTAVSDPLPQIWHGIPLRVRQLSVTIDRPSFTRNPTSCASKQVRALVIGARGAQADLADAFQAQGCAGLRFKPRLGLRLTGRGQMTTGKHPGVRARVVQRGGEAGIRRVRVRLPRSLALDPENAQALCEFEDGTKADLENHCPKGSIVGRARAVSPLLNHPLTGDVYFVKNVRVDPRTGNRIRTLPMIIVALRGEIAINLKGTSATARDGRLVNTFAKVPDAPVRRFNMTIAGGRNGILAVTRTRRSKINVCRGRHVAEADIDAHNGRRADQLVTVRTPCRKAARGKRRR